tara:strand:- start:1081 stop:1620 length:540 start_codon:yes stop_codon:yes gene_type:complete
MAGKKKAVKKAGEIIKALTGDAAKRERTRKIIARRKARQKKDDAKIEKELKRVDVGTPPGPPLKSVGVPKKGIEEEIAEAPIPRSSQKRKFTKEVSPEVKLQREWDGMTPAVRRAERVKYEETGKSKFSVLIKKGSAKTGSKVRKNVKREKQLSKLGTFKQGGLANTKYKDYRKGGIFY